MNKRIKELMEQATEEELDYTESGVPFVVREFVPKKFAELLVRECLDIASEIKGEPASDTHFVIGYHRACEKMIDAIKEHFGVE